MWLRNKHGGWFEIPDDEYINKQEKDKNDQIAKQKAEADKLNGKKDSKQRLIDAYKRYWNHRYSTDSKDYDSYDELDQAKKESGLSDVEIARIKQEAERSYQEDSRKKSEEKEKITTKENTFEKEKEYEVLEKRKQTIGDGYDYKVKDVNGNVRWIKESNIKKEEKKSESRKELDKMEKDLKSDIKVLEKNMFDKGAMEVLKVQRARLDEHDRFNRGREDSRKRLSDLVKQEHDLTSKYAFKPEARQTLKELRARIKELRRIIELDDHS